ncbi:MAG: site-specific integrase [candidate division WOR-3 bacterium]
MTPPIASMEGPDELVLPPISLHLERTIEAVRDQLNNITKYTERSLLMYQAATIERLLNGLVRLSPTQTIDNQAPESNVRLFLEHLVNMLRRQRPSGRPSIKPKTILNYCAGMIDDILEVAGTTNLLALRDPDAVIHLVAQALRCHSHPATRRTYRLKWKLFIEHLQTEGVPSLNTRDCRLTIPGYDKPYFLLLYEDIDWVIAEIMTSEPVRLAEDLRLACLQAGHLGLRLHEIHNVRLQDFYVSQGIIFLFIHISKSRAGLRTIPLTLLLHPNDLQLFIIQWTRRCTEVSGDLSRPFLALAEPGTGLSENELGRLLGKYIKKLDKALQLEADASLHDFRHTALSFLLLRYWLARFDLPPADLTLNLSHRLFQSECLAGIRTLLDGPGKQPPANGADLYDPILYAISRVAGHASPDITIGTYLHTFDLLHLLSIFREDIASCERLTLPPLAQTEVANLLLCSGPTARTRLRVAGHPPTPVQAGKPFQYNPRYVLKAQIAELTPGQRHVGFRQSRKYVRPETTE